MRRAHTLGSVDRPQPAQALLPAVMATDPPGDVLDAPLLAPSLQRLVATHAVWAAAGADEDHAFIVWHPAEPQLRMARLQHPAAHDVASVRARFDDEPHDPQLETAEVVDLLADQSRTAADAQIL